jgi:hypothetical protein
MPALKQYTPDSPQSGVYIIANVGGSHPVTLQVTQLGRRIFERLGYKPGDDVPTRFVWSLYDVGILYTEGTLNQDPELPADPAEVFEQLEVPGKLTPAERADLMEWLAEYNGPNESQVSSLREALEAERGDEKGSVDTTTQQSGGTRSTTSEPPSTSKEIAGRFLDIEVRAAGYREIPDRSQESYIECFVLLVEVSNYADADWDFNPRKEVTVTTKSGTSLGKPLEPFPRELGEYSAGGTTISPSASRQIVLIYPAEDGVLDVGQLEYNAKLLHRHAGISHDDSASSDYERISIDIDVESLPPLPKDLNLNQVWLNLRTEDSIERATAIDIELVGWEWSEREQIMFLFLEIENNTPNALSPMRVDFTVVSEEGYTFNQAGDGSYRGLPDAWATVTIHIPTGARGRVMLPFGTDKPFIPKQLFLERSEATVQVESDDETIEHSWGAPDAVDISDIRIDFR